MDALLNRQVFNQTHLHHLAFNDARNMMSVAAENVKKQALRDYDDNVNTQLDRFKRQEAEHEDLEEQRRSQLVQNMCVPDYGQFDHDYSTGTALQAKSSAITS